jgi:hypothetical protein
MIPIVLCGGLLLVGCEDEELPTAQASNRKRASKNKAPRAAPKAPPAVSVKTLAGRAGREDVDPSDLEAGDPNRPAPDPDPVDGPPEDEPTPAKKKPKLKVAMPSATPFAFGGDKDNPKAEKLGGREAGPKRAVRLPEDTPMTTEQAIAAITKAKGRIERDDDGNVIKVFLNRTEINDKSLRPVKYLPTIEVLNITGTRVSDAGLVYIKQLTGLRHLYPDRTRISDEGIASLKEALPKLVVLE